MNTCLTRPLAPWLVAILPFVASCASIIGLEDAAGELEENGATSGSTSTGTGAPVSTSTASAGGGGAGGDPATTTTGDGGKGGDAGDGGAGGSGDGGAGGGPGPVAFDVAFIEGAASIRDLQAGLGSAMFLAVDGIEEAGALRECEWVAPASGLDRSALALKITNGGECQIAGRIDVAGSQLAIRSVGVSFDGSFLGLGGTFQGTFASSGGGESLAANSPVAFAALAAPAFPYVGFTDPDLLGDGDGVGFVGGRGSVPTFFGHFEGTATISALAPMKGGGFSSNCPATGAAGVTTIAAFPVDPNCDPSPPHPNKPGVVVDVVSTSQRLGALYLMADGSFYLALMGSAADNQVLVELFPGVEDSARLAIEGAETLIGGTARASTIADAHCGVDLLVRTDSAFGAHVNGINTCDGLWVDARYRRAVPVGALSEVNVYLVESVSELPDERGWWIAATDDLHILAVRRFCRDCTIVDASLAGGYAYVAGGATAGDQVGGVDAELTGAFVARIPRADLLTGGTPLPEEP